MNRNASTFEAPDFVLVDGDGILDPIAVQRFADHLYDFVDDLVENGEARDLSVQGLIWVLAGLAFQIAGGPAPTLVADATISANERC